MIWLWVVIQVAAAAPAPLDLGTLESRALAQHPAVRRALAEVESAKGHERQAGAWSNPIVGGSAEEVRPRETRSGAFGAFVQQTIPFGGKLNAATTVASRNVAVAQASLEETRQAIAASVRSRYYALLLAEERTKVSEQLSALGNESLAIAKQLFNVGIADQPDVLLAEAEAARSKATLAAATATRLGAWQELAAAVGEQAMAPQALPSAGEALPALEQNSTLSQVVAGSRAVDVAVRSAEALRSAIALERASMRPDLFVRADAGANREQLQGRAIGPQFGLELGISVPLFNRNRGGIAAAASTAIAADARVDELKLDLRGRFAGVFAEYEGARVLVNAYRTEILPKAQRAYELHLEKYQQMVAPYPAVLQAQRTLIELNEQYLQALDRAWAALAALRSSLAVRTLSPGESR